VAYRSAKGIPRRLKTKQNKTKQNKTLGWNRLTSCLKSELLKGDKGKTWRLLGLPE